MDYNLVCKDSSVIGLCNYLANIYKLYKAVQDTEFKSPPFNPIPQPSNQNKDCQPDRFSYLLGSTFDPKTQAFKLKDGKSVTLSKNNMDRRFRIVGPTTGMTMDYVTERLNIYYENEAKKSEVEGIVTEVKCG